MTYQRQQDRQTLEFLDFRRGTGRAGQPNHHRLCLQPTIWSSPVMDNIEQEEQDSVHHSQLLPIREPNLVVVEQPISELRDLNRAQRSCLLETKDCRAPQSFDYSRLSPEK